MHLHWTSVAAGDGLPDPGTSVEMHGGFYAPEDMPPGYVILQPEVACCIGCPPDPATAVEVLFAGEAPRGIGPHRVTGIWHPLSADDATGWRWQLRDAIASPASKAPGPWLRRRTLLAAGPLLCAVPACTDAAPSPAARALVDAAVPMDLHSHAGHVILNRIRPRAFEAVAAPMRDGGMRLIALAIVADSPTTTVTPDRRIEAYRSPAPGELYAHSQAAFARLAEFVASQGLMVVTNQSSLGTARAPSSGPSVVVASEGADWLEGRLERLQDSFQAQRLRHLQLVHYRVNELGDIQTAAPVHEGLTAFGADVVRACNRLGVVVDVAHGTYWLTKRAAEVTEKPLVLSHTGLSSRPSLRSRWITPEHARLVASTGGVIGVWPLTGSEAATMRAYAQSIARMVDAVGVDHVGIGSDMLGLLGTSAFGDYRETPVLAEALLAQGFSQGDAAKILGGNYARVLAATLPAG